MSPSPSPIRIDIEATDGAARAGTVTTPRGTFKTPCFMPVGTRGAVRTLSAADLDALGCEIVLANTYHLMLRPGTETVAALGGLPGFTGWRDGLFLTDSGGFQVFSLQPKVDDDGVTFRSTYDGSLHRLTPEIAVQIQQRLGADIQMVLDVCPPLPSPPETVRLAVERTAAWAARARKEHAANDHAHAAHDHAANAHADRDYAAAQALFGIVQGGVDPALRQESAQRTVELGFDGYGIGGLSVGESRAEMLPALEAAIARLPVDKPRYLMGVGDPVGLVEAIARGVDMFDCVLPTRLARHGTVLSSEGRYQIKNAGFAADDGPLDPACACAVCARHSRAYIRHLLQTAEPTAPRLLTLHNVAWTFALVERSRAAIAANTLERLRADVASVWS